MFVDERRKFADLAYELQREMVEEIPEDKRRVQFDRESLMDMGMKLWKDSYKDCPDDRQAFSNLMDFFSKSGNYALAGMMMLPCDQITMVGTARWADQGFPQIVTGHKYAAALMATHVPAEVASLVRPPWKAFLLEIPDNMLPILDNNTNREVFLRRVLVQHVVLNDDNDEPRESWQYVGFTDQNLSIWKHGVSTAELSNSNIKDNGIWEGAAFALAVESLDVATTTLLGKLIANICLAMSDPNNVVSRPENGSVGSVPSQRTGKLRTYKVGKPISIDARQALDDYIHGRKKGASPSVQTIVRGHWKPKLAERVGHPVWVEPYTRGPDDAPVLVRPTILK